MPVRAVPGGRSRTGGRRRAPTAADIVVILFLAAVVPLSRGLGAPGGSSDRLIVRGADSDERILDTRGDHEVELRGPLGVTLVQVRNGEAWIARAPCRNRLCQRMGRLRGPGRSLVCIPNRIVVRFAGTAEDVDAVTR